ncbi:MAG: NAD-binding protein [Dermatophilaceae bacterium]
MPNPLLFIARPWGRRHPPPARRRVVDVPTEAASTDAIFLVLRRLRTPMVVLVVIFAVSVAGLAMIPGQDAAGNPARMTVFDAFYFMSYTATTIGFGELPNAFTTTQRMWVTASIYASVIGWAFAIGTVFALLQDQGFREALRVQQMRRKVRRMDEPFLIVAGYGQAGRQVCRSLDDARRRFVVIDDVRSRIEALAMEQMVVDVPAIDADVRSPAVLGLAGLGHRHCEGVLALTDDDDTNLAVVMTVKLLRPDVPVIARCGDRSVEEHMHDFDADAVINPNDRYGGYLLLALQRPVVHQLVTWLMSQPGTPLPPAREGLHGGRWVVCADGQFGAEVADDLRSAGLDVTMADPHDGNPDVAGAAGLVAGTERDISNLALAEHARISNPSIYLCVRQKANTQGALVRALDIDSVYIATELVARESLARVVTPVYWGVLDHVLNQDDAWASGLLASIVERCGTRTPERALVRLTSEQTPSVVRWLRRHDLTLGDLLRHPDERTQPVAAFPLVLLRDDEPMFVPSGDEPLRAGDGILLLGDRAAFAALTDAFFSDAAVEYVATGHQVPSTWIWRLIAQRRHPASAG